MERHNKTESYTAGVDQRIPLRTVQEAGADSRKPGPAVRECVSACFFCACYCGVIISLDKDDRIVKVVGDKKNPNSKGFICNKGVNMHTHLDNSQRLDKPLKRIDGKLQEISWEAAILGIGEKLKDIRERHSPRSIGMCFGGAENNTLAQFHGSLMLAGLGSRSMYSPVGIEFMSKWQVNEKMFGVLHMNGHPDFNRAEYIILMGGNPLASAPIEGPDLKRASKDPRRSLVVIDPRRTETAALADQHLMIRPSTDIFFLLAMLRVIINKGLYDQAHVDQYCTGFDAVKAAVQPFDLKHAEQMTAIPAASIERIAVDYASTDKALLFYHMGLVANRHSTLVSWVVQVIKVICNKKGREGTTLISPQFVDFNKLSGLMERGEKYRSRLRPQYEEVGNNLPVSIVPEEILTPGEGQVRAMIVSGCNPLKGFGNSAEMERAFDDLELLVSIDPFLTEVGRRADYVLPAACFQEQDNISFPGSWIFKHSFYQYLQKIREPRGDSWPEWKIYRRLLQATGPHGIDQKISSGVFTLIEKCYQWLGKGEQFEQPEWVVRIMAYFSGSSWKELQENPHGFIHQRETPYEYLQELGTDDKKVQLAVPEYIASLTALRNESLYTCKDFPLLLQTTCRTKANSNTMYHNKAWQKKNFDANRLLVHRSVVEPLGIDDGGEVNLVSETGSAIVKIEVSEDLMPQAIFLSHGWGLMSRDRSSKELEKGVSAGQFISHREGDEFTGMPFMNGVPCRLERV